MRLWAVASLTVKEAVRRKAFLALVLFAVALVSSMTFFSSVDPVSKLRLIEIWSHRATIFFAAIAAVFLGASSFPADCDQKRIYVVVSKPISKVTFFLGKYVGFMIVVAIFLLVMGAITVAYVRIVKLLGGPMIPELRARPRVRPASIGGEGGVESVKEELRVYGMPPGTRILSFAPIDVSALGEPVLLHGVPSVRSFVPGWTTGSLAVEIRGPDTPFARTIPIRHGEPFQIELPLHVTTCPRLLEVRLSPSTGDSVVGLRDVALAGSRRSQGPEDDRIEGNAYPEAREVRGCAAGSLRWRFEGLRAADFPETVSGRLILKVGGIRNPYRYSARVRVVVETDDRSARHEAEIEVQSNEWTPVDFPRRILEPGRPVDLHVIPTDPDIRLVGRLDTLVLFSSDESFEWNYVKGLGLIYCWILLVLTVAVMASSILSAPVSMLAGIVVLLVGTMHEFVGEGVRDIDVSLARAEEAHKHGKPAKTPEGLPPWLLESSRWGSKVVLFAFPGSKTFDFSRFLLNDFAVGADDLRRALLAVLPRVAIVVLVGLLVVFFRDFG
ncbi:MAG: hypothetical protein HYY17_17300 [Planctomycetes bacterium]|nr:hypothetical protein [Planctomycetota bacterium]